MIDFLRELWKYCSGENKRLKIELKAVQDQLRERGNPDPEAFLERLGRVRISEDYTHIDRYRDFHSVFFGESTAEQGRRVLSQIFEWVGFYRSSYVRGDPYETHINEGARNIGIRLIATLDAEPMKLVDTSQTEGEEE